MEPKDKDKKDQQEDQKEIDAEEAERRKKVLKKIEETYGDEKPWWDK